MRHPSYYYRALPESTRAAFDLNLEAIALSREQYPDFAKIAKCYADAIAELKKCIDEGSTKYIWLLRCRYGGWGEYRLNGGGSSLDGAANRILRLYELFSEIPSDGKIARALEKLEAGDFTHIDSYIYTGYKPPPSVVSILASLGCASVMKLMNVVELKQFIPSKNFTSCVRYARASPTHACEVIRTLETTSPVDPFIRDFIGWFGGDDWPVAEYAIAYIVGSARNCTLDYVTFLSRDISIDHCRRTYNERIAEYRKKTIAWLCFARGNVCRDIAVMIGKMVYAARYEFDL